MSSDADQPQAKRAKTEDSNNAGDADIHLDLKDFAKFKFGEVLKEDPVRKTLALKATVDGSTDPAVVFLEKSAFTEECGKKILESDTALKQTFHNDIYGSYTGFPQQELNGVKVTITHPATDKHIAKFSAKESILVNETPQLYKDVLLEHLKESAVNVQWVYNILQHRSEQERIVCEDADPETGFVLVPDLKWDGESLKSLYLQALVHRRGLRSIRDLTADHLPLLRNIRDKGCEAIEKKYGVPASELRVYFHYQPSYYHLHVHFTSVQFDAPGTHLGKAHFLSTVINNLELVPDYYQRATLTYYLPSGVAALADKLRRATQYQERATEMERGNNLVIHGLKESQKVNTNQRKDDDRQSVTDLIKAVCGDSSNLKIVEVIRLGKKDESRAPPSEASASSSATPRPRVLLVKFETKEDANRLFQKRLELKDAGFQDVFIHRDENKEERKKQYKLRKELKAKGRDTHKIFRGSVIPRGD